MNNPPTTTRTEPTRDVGNTQLKVCASIPTPCRIIGLCVDTRGNIYGAASSDRLVVRFGPDGVPLGQHEITRNGPLCAPGDLVPFGDGFVLVDPTSNAVLLTDSAFHVTSSVRIDHTGAGRRSLLNSVAVDEERGRVYVTDAAASRIVVLDTSLETVATIGGSDETSPSWLVEPMSIAVERAGTILVGDNGAQQVKRFTADGRFVGAFGTPGWGIGSIASFATGGMALDAGGNLFVAQHSGQRITKFTAQGAFAYAFFSIESPLRNPAGLWCTADGRLHISDINNFRILVAQVA